MKIAALETTEALATSQERAARAAMRILNLALARKRPAAEAREIRR